MLQIFSNKQDPRKQKFFMQNYYNRFATLNNYISWITIYCNYEKCELNNLQIYFSIIAIRQDLLKKCASFSLAFDFEICLQLEQDARCKILECISHVPSPSFDITHMHWIRSISIAYSLKQ